MIAFFGVAFDPVHFGHLKPILELGLRPEVQEVHFLPCYQYPQHCHRKAMAASPKHRLAMLDLVATAPKLAVNDYEIKHNHASYTTVSLSGLRQHYGRQQSLCFVLGDDAFNHIHLWHDYTRLLDYAHLLVLTRPQFTIRDEHPLLRRVGGWSSCIDLAKSPAGGIARLFNQTHNISSSLVRDLVAEQKEPRYYLPAKVWRYIQRHRLYGWRGGI